MVVVERVEHHLAGAALANEPRAAQQPQLVRDRRLAEAEDVGDITDVQFASGQARRRMRTRVASAEHLEGVGERLTSSARSAVS